MPLCFISYSRSDQVNAENLSDSLISYGYETWLDINQVRGGELWEQEISKAIAESDIILVVITPDALKSDWVKREIDIAKSLSKNIIPLLMRPIAVKDELSILDIDEFQYIEFTRYGNAKALEQLLDVLPTIASENANSQKRALVIENEPVDQSNIQQILEDMHIQVSIAGNIAEALELIRGERFDLVTLDMQLNVFDDPKGKRGLFLLDQLHTYQTWVPVIIISHLPWDGKDVRDFIREYDVFDYIHKDYFKPGDLRPLVEKALKHDY